MVGCMESDWAEPLADLKWHYGEGYMIYCLGLGRWLALRRDNYDCLKAEGPEELRVRMMVDSFTRPVPRTLIATEPAFQDLQTVVEQLPVRRGRVRRVRRDQGERVTPLVLGPVDRVQRQPVGSGDGGDEQERDNDDSDGGPGFLVHGWRSLL